MMKQCVVCGKGSVMGGKRNLLRGKYNPTSHQRKYANLQQTRLDGKRVLMCTKCMKKRTK